ncbi:hypothetical protein BBJ28_00023088 [Nothophytophthora sp. Chile5]|nr:hypothetical protein BBJ28_00023088 [Nothophytophthora sp. Chile5]
MGLLIREVETVIANILPKSFGIIFDGWTFRSDHYVAVFASFRHNGKAQNILIVMAPIIDDEVDDHTASSHVKFLGTILSYYGRSRASIANIVGDNRSVNGAVVDQLQVPMVGSASHRLNLAVNLLLADDDDLFEKVQKLMCKLKNSLLAAAKTFLRLVLRQDTRWSSTFAMVKRYFELKVYLDDDDDDEGLTAVMPSRREEKQTKVILDNLKMFESTSKKLQSADDITLLNVRDLFYALIAQKPEVAHYLDAEAAIVKSVDFERACVSVLLGREGLMSAKNVAMLEPLSLLAENYNMPTVDKTEVAIVVVVASIDIDKTENLVTLPKNCISIRRKYMSYVSLVMSSKLWDEVKVHDALKSFETPHNFNALRATDSAVVHGLTGYFGAVFFGDVMVRIEADTHSDKMLRRFPCFFPLRQPLRIQKEELVASFWCLKANNLV